MRYLKTNESVAGINKLQSYCENNLSYLTDMGCDIEVNEINRRHSTDHYEILIKRMNPSDYDGYNPFTWEEVMYDVIPFIIQLNKEFILLPMQPSGRVEILEINHTDNRYNSTNTYYSIDELTDSNTDFDALDDVRIYILRIRVSKKSPKLKYLR
jgi:hypothetical protein